MPNKKILILGHTILPGKSLKISLDIAKLHTRTKIEVPVIIERGKEDGPCLLITGGIHGNEVNGIEIVRQLISKKYNIPHKGTIICIPVVNVFGFLNLAREFPDGRDLNRVFPGSKRGSLAGRFAYHLINEILPHVDYCIDYHTGGGERFNVPQIRIHDGDAEILELAKAFNAPFILKSKNIEKSFRQTCVKNNKKIILFEGGKSSNINHEVTQAGINGAINVIHKIGLKDYSSRITKTNTCELIEDSLWVRAKYSGMYRSVIKVGSYINKGDVIGSISDPYGDFEKDVKAPNSGFIICANECPIVNQGDALIHLSKGSQHCI